MITYLSRVSASRLKGKALVRLDFNTEDEWRMQASLPTLRYLAKCGAVSIIVSHRGRPRAVSHGRGLNVKNNRKLSLRRDAVRLGRFLKRPVAFIQNFSPQDIQKRVARAKPGAIFLLENIRFVRGETENNTVLGKKLASLADYFVNDAFAVSHRKVASVVAVARHLPAYAGLELQDEIAHLQRVMKKPRKPLLVILGGGKAHDKLPMMKYYKRRASFFLVGGTVSNTILKARGINIGISRYDDKVGAAIHEIIKYKNVVLPIDYAVNNGMILDVGPKTVALLARHVKKASTIIWNGPFGVIENPRYRHGTLGIARAIAKNKSAFSFVGGGETVMILKKYGLDKKFTFISTGGGAMLEYLSGKRLPGIEALRY